MNVDRVAELLKAKKQPAYRLAQAKRVFFVELGKGWDDVTTYPAAMRQELSAEVPWNSLTVARTHESSDGHTIKFLLTTADGKSIETVLMRHEDDRNTVCISSQIGCAMACSFCATGTMGFSRNLTVEEMVDQVVHAARWLKPKKGRVSNIVFMGMGEPMNNFDNVVRAIEILNDAEGLNIGARHITISTCGIVPGIRKLAEVPLQVNLAISLHSGNNLTRTKIMPVNRAYPLPVLMKAVDAYAEKTNRKVFFEYLLLMGINDTQEEAEALAKLLKHNIRLFHVNLIKYHDTDMFDATPRERRISFMHKLQRLGIPVTHRISFGEDIDAACGQLAVNAASGVVIEGIEAAKENRAAKKEKLKK